MEDDHDETREPICSSAVFVEDASVVPSGEQEERNSYGSDSDVVLMDTKEEEKTPVIHEQQKETLLTMEEIQDSQKEILNSVKITPGQERLISKDVFEEGECEEVITEVTTPDKVTKTIKTTSITKTTSIKVINVRGSEGRVTTSEDIAAESGVEKPSETGCGDHGHSKARSEVLADSTSHDLEEVVNADSTSADLTDETMDTASDENRVTEITQTQTLRSKRGKSRQATPTPSQPGNHGDQDVVTTASRRGRTKATMTTPSLHVARDTVMTPSRRSTRLSKTEESEAILELEQVSTGLHQIYYNLHLLPCDVVLSRCVLSSNKCTK
jgi:hypothetical protein